MKKWTKIKWVVALSMLGALFATTSVAYGGLRWSGIDPQLEVNGHDVAATVIIPTAEACQIEGDTIELAMLIPSGADWDGTVMESSEDFDCDGEERTITTKTRARFARVDDMYVAAMVPADDGDRFRVRLMVEVDGHTVRRCHGYSDSLVECRGFDVD